jgi:hypothetical protein
VDALGLLLPSNYQALAASLADRSGHYRNPNDLPYSVLLDQNSSRIADNAHGCNLLLMGPAAGVSLVFSSTGEARHQ